MPTWEQLPRPITLWESLAFADYCFLDDLSKEEFDFTEYVPEGGYITLLRDVSISPGPVTIGNPDDISRTWVSYADEDDIWIARASEDLMEWEYRLNVVSAPSGATRPSVVFDGGGNYVIYVEFLPAGSSQKEVWIVEYPYSGEGVRKLFDGQYPKGYRHPNGTLYVFYQNVTQDQILYRADTNSYSSSYVVPLEPEFISGVYPLGVKTNFEDISPEHGFHILHEYTPILFWTNVSQEEELPWYKVAEVYEFSKWITAFYLDPYENVSMNVGLEGIDWVEIITLSESYEEDISTSIGLDNILWEVVLPRVHFTILDSSDMPLEGVDISWDGQVYTTDINGQVTTHPTENGVYPYDMTYEGITYTHIIGISSAQIDDIYITDYFLPWNTDMDEDISMQTSLDDIEWMEIITLSEEYDEDISMSIGLDSILWVEIFFFDVTFHKNGGDTEADPQTLTVESGETVDSLPSPPTREGYTFEGWNTSADGSGDIFDTSYEVTTDITVYAQWEEED